MYTNKIRHGVAYACIVERRNKQQYVLSVARSESVEGVCGVAVRGDLVDDEAACGSGVGEPAAVVEDGAFGQPRKRKFPRVVTILDRFRVMKWMISDALVNGGKGILMRTLRNFASISRPVQFKFSLT